MKMFGRRHRPFFRVCAVDGRTSRDGKVIEYLGHYDPMVKETDARAVLNKARIDYWLSVGAQPSDKVAVLIKKYGSNGTHVEQQQQAIQRLKAYRPMAPPPVPIPKVHAQEPAGEGQSGGRAEGSRGSESGEAAHGVDAERNVAEPASAGSE
jgi:small subunit ribosomal protein S16